MNMKHNHLFFLLTMLCSNLTYAQKAWTLDECIGYAIENNLQLNDFKYLQQSNKETYNQSIRDLLPTLNGYADYSINFGRSINPEDNSVVNTEFFSSNGYLYSSLDVFQGFQKVNTIKASKFIYQATRQESLQQKYLLAFEVMSAYYDIQFIEGLLDIATEQVTISERNYALVKKQVELGLVAGADLYEAESLLLTDQLSVTQNKNRLEAAKLTLMQAMNMQNEEGIEVQPALLAGQSTESSDPVNANTVFMKAKSFMPSLQAQRYRIEAAKKQVAVARGALYPSISLDAGIGTGFFETITDGEGNTVPFRNQFSDNTYKVVSASLTVPIFNAWTSRSNINQQKIALKQAENTAETTEQALYQTIQQLVQEHHALVSESAQTEAAMKSQQTAFTIAQKRYEKGLINAIELGQAKTLYATAQNQHLQAQLRFLVNTSTLDFYEGLPLFNFN